MKQTLDTFDPEQRSIFQLPPPSTYATKVTTPISTKSARPRYNRNLADSEISSGSSGRKRARHSYTRESNDADVLATPLHEWSDITPVTSSTAYFSSALPSPAPFVNTKYELRGGLDTPTRETELRYDSLQSEEDECIDYLRPNRLYPTSLLRLQEGEVPVTPQAGISDSRGRKRKMDSGRPGWTRTIVTTVGGIAWKGINLCWTTAFGGFQAGGGAGYQMPMGTPMIVAEDALDRVDRREDVFDESYEGKHIRDHTPIPGEFPEDDMCDQGQSDHLYNPTQSKHSLDNKENKGPSQDDWALVEKNEVQRDRRVVQDRRQANPTPPLRRPASSASIAGTRQSSPSLRRPPLTSQASSPSLRSTSLASPRRLHRSSNPDLARSGGFSSPSKGRSSLSTASPARRPAAYRATQGSTSWANASPDVQKFERKVRMKEKREDENISRLNKQLKDMIREGKEALGTKIDIESDEDEDEGYAEGDAW